MLNIPETVKALYKRDGVNKNFRAHFPNGELPDITNENIVQESVKFQESVCSQDVFKFGLTEASVIEFETVGVANMYGMTIACYNEIDCSSLSAAEIADIEAGTWDGTWDGTNKVFAVPYGVYRVESCPRDHQAMAHRKVTAYTQTLNQEIWFPRMRDTFTWNQISADWQAIYACYFRDNLTALNDVSLIFNPDNNALDDVAYLYDSDGNGYAMSIQRSTGSTWAYAERYLSIDEAGQVASFIELLTDDSTAQQYEAFGQAVVDAIEDRNLDITYDRSGSKLYKSNYEAIKATYPHFFAPAVAYSGRKKNGTAIGYTLYNPTDYGEIIPVLQKSDAAITSITSGGKYDAVSVRYLAHESGYSYRIQLHKISNGSTYPSYPPLDAVPPASGSITLRPYRLTSNGFRLKFFTTDDKGTSFNRQIAGNTSVKYKTYPFSVDMVQLLNGALELSAAFSFADRAGGITFKRLDNTSPVAVAPTDYSQMWFDEYDVQPIGTIRYAYTDEAGEEQVVEYGFGDGESIYDMTDNAVLKSMDGASPTVIESLLDTSFVPHLSAVSFVPIDLAAKGLPYIEAGDALAVTAQDGTVCSSYALRRELNGVQVLTDQIDSQSGLIIDSEEGGT